MTNAEPQRDEQGRNPASEHTIAAQRAFAATFLAWTLDGFDFSVLTFILLDIRNSFTVDAALAGALGTVTLFFRLAGGLGAGMMADRWGRKLPLMLSILWFSLFAFLSGFSTSYAMLFACRALFGIGMGHQMADRRRQAGHSSVGGHANDSNQRRKKQRAIPFHILTNNKAGTAARLHRGLDNQIIIKLCRRQIIRFDSAHGKDQSISLHLDLINPQLFHPLAARALNEFQIIRVIDDPGQIRVFVINANRKTMGHWVT